MLPSPRRPLPLPMRPPVPCLDDGRPGNGRRARDRMAQALQGWRWQARTATAARIEQARWWASVSWQLWLLGVRRWTLRTGAWLLTAVAQQSPDDAPALGDSRSQPRPCLIHRAQYWRIRSAALGWRPLPGPRRAAERDRREILPPAACRRSTPGRAPGGEPGPTCPGCPARCRRLP